MLLRCPACNDLMRKAMVTACGHTFCGNEACVPEQQQLPPVPNYMVRDVVAEHPAQCRWCDHKAPLGQLEDEHEPRCPRRPPRCPNRGCVFEAATQELVDAHQTRRCTLRPVACGGCGDVMAACRLMQHRCPAAMTTISSLTRGETAVVHALAATGDSQLLVASHGELWMHRGGDTTVMIHDAGEAVMTALAVLPGGGDGAVAAASVDGTVTLWEPRRGRYDRTEVLRGHDEAVYSLAVSTAALFSGSVDTTVRVWRRPAPGEQHECAQVLRGHTATVYALVTLSETVMVSGSEDRTLRVWRKKRRNNEYECAEVLRDHTGRVYALAALGGGGTDFVSGGHDNTVRVWRSFRCTEVLLGHMGWVWSVAVLGDGVTVVSGGGDRVVRVWQPSDDDGGYECQRVLEGHESHVYTLAVMGDGRTVVGGGFDGGVRAWVV